MRSDTAKPAVTTAEILTANYGVPVAAADGPFPDGCTGVSGVMVHTGDPTPWCKAIDVAPVTSVTDEVDDTGEIVDAAALDRILAQDLAVLVAGNGVSTNQIATHLHRAKRYHAFLDTLVFADRATESGNRCVGRRYRDILSVARTGTTQAYEHARDAGIGTPMLVMTIGDETTAYAGRSGGFDHDALGDLVGQALAAAGDRRSIDAVEFDVLAS